VIWEMNGWGRIIRSVNLDLVSSRVALSLSLCVCVCVFVDFLLSCHGAFFTSRLGNPIIFSLAKRNPATTASMEFGSRPPLICLLGFCLLSFCHSFIHSFILCLSKPFQAGNFAQPSPLTSSSSSSSLLCIFHPHPNPQPNGN